MAAAAPSPGLADPVFTSQAVFRAAMEAMAHPGRLVAVPDCPAPPAPLHPAAAALCLTLADFDAPLWLDATAATAAVGQYLRFHTGAPITLAPAEAAFAVIAGAVPDLSDFAAGTDPFPERSTTLIVQVRGLSAGGPRTLRGPGIDGAIDLGVDGPGPTFWQDWRRNSALFPRGVDVIFTAQEVIVGLPRGTQVEA